MLEIFAYVLTLFSDDFVGHKVYCVPWPLPTRSKNISPLESSENIDKRWTLFSMLLKLYDPTCIFKHDFVAVKY